MGVKECTVKFEGRAVGTIAETADHRFAFAYDAQWLRDGFPISPFSLPLQAQVFVPAKPTFGGLWGVFADSLPDAWGRLLVDRMLTSRQIRPESISPLERLTIVGASGMGALTYVPAWEHADAPSIDDLDALARDCAAILNRAEPSDADALFRLGGSSGGARPKVCTPEWVIKFPASIESLDAGVMEKAYMDCAADCGIDVPETRLLPSKRCGGYFSARRFDRQSNPAHPRVHMLTAAAILEIDHRTPSLDYHTLMKLTRILCREEDVRQMYRRMCFNVFAHNRDDHAKNFAYLYDPDADAWHLSPAYDLTYSTTYWGQHTTTVDGVGDAPDLPQLIAVGRKAGMAQAECRHIAEEIREKALPLATHWSSILSAERQFSE